MSAGCFWVVPERVRHFKAGEFERAIRTVENGEPPLVESEIRSIQDHFGREMEEASESADFQAVRRWRRRSDRFAAYCCSGFDPKSLIKPADVPLGYRGKILLITIVGGLFDGIIGLRSNDLYHRDILRNAEVELEDLGLFSSRVYELGGAYLAAKPDGSLHIWGSSDEFGTCDHELAAQLVRSLFPEKSVLVEA